MPPLATPLPMSEFIDGDKEEDDTWVSSVIDC
jgi:hypothetical protein